MTPMQHDAERRAFASEAARIDDLAETFSATIRAFLSPDELAEANRRNQAAGMDRGVCHTHDFCDANDAMLAAWSEVTGEDCMDFDDEQTAEVVNEAWQRAKVALFALGA